MTGRKRNFGMRRSPLRAVSAKSRRLNDWNVLEFHTDVFGGKWFYVACCGWLPWSTT